MALSRLRDNGLDEDVPVPRDVNGAPCGAGRRAGVADGAGGHSGAAAGRAAQAEPSASPSPFPPGAGIIAVIVVTIPVDTSRSNADGSGSDYVTAMALRAQAASEAFSLATGQGSCEDAATCCGFTSTELCPFMRQLSASSGMPLAALVSGFSASYTAPVLPSLRPAAGNAQSALLSPSSIGGISAGVFAAAAAVCAGAALVLRRRRRRRHASGGRGVRSALTLRGDPRQAAADPPLSAPVPASATTMNPLWARGKKGGAAASAPSPLPLHLQNLAAGGFARVPGGRTVAGRGPRAAPLLQKEAQPPLLWLPPAASQEDGEDEPPQFLPGAAEGELDQATLPLQPQPLSRALPASSPLSSGIQLRAPGLTVPVSGSGAAPELLTGDSPGWRAPGSRQWDAPPTLGASSPYGMAAGMPTDEPPSPAAPQAPPSLRQPTPRKTPRHENNRG